MGYPVNTEYDDFGLVYYDRELHGYFSSSRPVEMKEGNKTIYDRSDHIYYLYSTVPPVQTYRLEVLDSITRQPLISTVTFIRSTKP